MFRSKRAEKNKKRVFFSVVFRLFCAIIKKNLPQKAECGEEPNNEVYFMERERIPCLSE